MAPLNQSGHPEDVCEDCGGANPVWFAPDELWNAVVGNPYGILCPTCFAGRAEASGHVGPCVWRFEPVAPRFAAKRPSGGNR